MHHPRTFIDKTLFTYLFLAFILATIIGTLTHEWGHYIVAEALGYDAIIHYGSTSIQNVPVDSTQSERFWISLGGPLQTMLTGIIGLILLFVKRKSFTDATSLSIRQWVLVLITLFWLRQPANLVTWLGGYLLNGRFSFTGDEIKLAIYLHLPLWSILWVTAIIGFSILAIIYFRFIPQQQRLTFLAAGLAGGITGYILWIGMFGKLIMP